MPEGAIITNLEGWVYDNDASALVRVKIRRQQNGSSDDEPVATVQTALATGFSSVQFLSTSLSHTVDNQNYAYFVWIDGYADNTDIRFYGARVTYTVSKAE